MSNDKGRRVAVTVIATCLAIATVVGGGGAASAESVRPAANPERILSHFLCYLGIFPIFDPEPVTLTDRFDTYGGTVLVPTLWCNPVRKKRGLEITPIVDERQHLKGYNVETDVVVGTDAMLVTNQFGADQAIEIDRFAFGILVPTKKAPHARPRGLDHFACYEVVPAAPIDKAVKLKDEFRKLRTRVQGQIAHCVPFAKTHGTTVTPIKHPRAHLACYQVDPRELDPHQSRKTRNQFERVRITAAVAQVLCVPSRMKSAP